MKPAWRPSSPTNWATWFWGIAWIHSTLSSTGCWWTTRTRSAISCLRATPAKKRRRPRSCQFHPAKRFRGPGRCQKPQPGCGPPDRRAHQARPMERPSGNAPEQAGGNSGGAREDALRNHAVHALPGALRQRQDSTPHCGRHEARRDEEARVNWGEQILARWILLHRAFSFPKAGCDSEFCRAWLGSARSAPRFYGVLACKEVARLHWRGIDSWRETDDKRVSLSIVRARRGGIPLGRFTLGCMAGSPRRGAEQVWTAEDRDSRGLV